MASLPWVPWPYPNRTEVLSPAQIERIVQMHKESKQNAIIYVLVVLAIYFVALAILVGRYLQNERDLDVVVCLGQVLERCVATCRRAAGPSATPQAVSPAGVPGSATLPVIASLASPPAPAQRKFSLRMTWSTLPPPDIKHTAVRKPPRPRPRAPQTDDESSESTSPPYSPAGCPYPCSPETPSSADGEGHLAFPMATTVTLNTTNSVNTVSWGRATTLGESPYAGRISPAVVSVMVCDLQDLQDTQV